MAEIFVLMGKSSTGKDTVYKKLKEEMPELKNIVIYTTRPRREGEEDGREYFFTDEEGWQALEKEGRIIESRAYETVHGIWKYFTVNDGQIDMNGEDKFLVIGTLEAYESFIRHYGQDHVVPIYIEVDDRTRIHRAMAREDAGCNPGYAEMCRRFLADEKDFSEEKIDGLGIRKRYQNLELTECISEIKADIGKYMV